jgi:hypothetical protein
MKKTVMIVSVAALLVALAPAAQAAVFTDNFDTPHNYLTGGLGAYDGLLNGGTIEAMDADTDHAGELYIQTDGANWSGANTGDLLYVEWTGDFVATVKVTDFAGTVGTPVYNNSAGILVRDPASGPENWLSVNYFPTWTGFIAWNNVNDVRVGQLGQVGRIADVDTYAIAEAHPWIQLERVGENFYPRISADGVNFIALTDPAYDGIPDGNQNPLDINRPYLPATLQLGLYQDKTATGGYAAFDVFSVVPEPATMSLLAIGGLALIRRRKRA